MGNINKVGVATSKDDETPKEITKFEDLLEMVGTNGWKNYLIFFAASMCGAVTALPIFCYQFLGATPEHWCLVPELINSNHNWTSDEIKEIAIPFSDDKYDSCLMKDLKYEEMTNLTFSQVKLSMEGGNMFWKNETNSSLQCNLRYFDGNMDTIVTEWDLVCDQRYLYSSTQAAVQLGMLIGSLFCGYLIDRFGRLKIYKISIIALAFGGFILAFSPNIYFFIIFRVLGAMFGMSFYMSAFILTMELCSTEQRSMVANYYVIPWTFGMMATPAIAYYIRQWQYLQGALTVPALFLFINFLILPESPRWLIMNYRFEEALDVFKNIAKSNKRELPEDSKMIYYMRKINGLNSSSEEKKEDDSFSAKLRSFFRHIFILLIKRSVRYQTLAIFFCWFAVAMVYYGVSLAPTIISTNDYLYIFLSGLIEIPAYLILWPMTVYLGRRKTVIAFFVICSFSIFSVMGLVLGVDKDSLSALKLILFLAGKLAITAAFHLIWVFTAELYPTKLRSLVVGEASMVARMGSIFSPYINDILGMKNPWVPAVIFGSVSLIAGGIAMVLPETAGKDLPDSIEKKESNENSRL